ncbi:hypothetical protein DSO57_1007719 [Entomophthora muscae]|uniref:Uncharacterized protein n=1 Tax=Entomophthora muscae TaxID=34485 RepID=A0ACC2SWB2_9FUNG|nr:hypothetical protein DSO57_1007719 [Entomophthora muscae]
MNCLSILVLFAYQSQAAAFYTGRNGLKVFPAVSKDVKSIPHDSISTRQALSQSRHGPCSLQRRARSRPKPRQVPKAMPASSKQTAPQKKLSFRRNKDRPSSNTRNSDSSLSKQTKRSIRRSKAHPSLDDFESIPKSPPKHDPFPDYHPTRC